MPVHTVRKGIKFQRIFVRRSESEILGVLFGVASMGTKLSNGQDGSGIFLQDSTVYN